jgi:DNA-binding NarL/FixJ family response regulator
MTKTLRVLILKTSEADAELIKHELSRAGLSAVTLRVECENTFSAALARPTTPLIIVSDSLAGDKTIACLRDGCEDVILNSNLGRLASSISLAVSVRRPLQKLTPRQIEVLRMVAEGHRTREIATRLQLSVKTVESHRGEVMKRLEMHDVVTLVRYAMRVGLTSAAA